MKSSNTLMRAFAIIGLIAAVSLVASPVMGATGTPLAVKTMKIAIWPEYDDPRIMVTYQGEFKDGSVFPQPVKFAVPLGSELDMVCALKPPKDDHLCQLYETQTGADDLAVSYTLPIPTYYIEYYWDGIKAQPDKSFNFKWVAPYAIDTLELEVQQPLRATDFKLTPQYATVTSDGPGFKYYHYVFNNVTPGQVISLDASYAKSDNKPSVAKKQPSGASSSGSSSSAGGSTYAFAGIGAALLAVAAIGFVLLKRKPAPAPVRNVPVQSKKAARAEARRIETRRHQAEIPRRPRPEPVTHGAAQAASRPQGGGFCSQCGTRLAAGSQFCHVCGARAKGTA